ncbi:hypothetical protein OHB00_49480 [Streptomyces sp. NBC_00631]
MSATRVGEEYVEVAVRRLDRFGDAQHVALARDVGSDPGGGRAELLSGGVEHVLAPACDVDSGSLFDQTLGGAEAESGRAAGDQGDPPLECLRFHVNLSCWAGPS